jgi:hypothetical protein
MSSGFAAIVTSMSSQRERAEEKRKEKLKAVEEQVAEGSLTIRQMTPEERAKYPKRERPPQPKRKRY